MNQRIKPKQAAAEIGCNVDYLKQQMRRGKWDLGEVVKPERRGGRHQYFIFRSKLDKFLGKEEIQNEASDSTGVFAG